MSLLAQVRARVHLPSAAVLMPYVAVVLDTIHQHPEWTATLTGTLGAAGAVLVPVALALLDSLVKKPRDGAAEAARATEAP